MLLKKLVTTAAATAAAAALTLGVASGVSYADDEGSSSGGSTATASASPSPTATASSSDTATATIRFQQQNVVITALTISDTATSTITVHDKRASSTITWDVPREVKMSGYYKQLRDLKVGFTIHLKGFRTGSAAPVAEHIVAPGRNKKVEQRHLTVVAVDGSAGTITVRDKKGNRTTWAVRSARVEGKARSLGALSVGDVVSLRGERVEGSGKGQASIVRVEKDVKPAKKKSSGKKK